MVGGRGAFAGFPARQEGLSRWLGVVLLDRRCSGASCLVLRGLEGRGVGVRLRYLTALSPSVEARRHGIQGNCSVGDLSRVARNTAVGPALAEWAR